jgi:hypothetical protein
MTDQERIEYFKEKLAHSNNPVEKADLEAKINKLRKQISEVKIEDQKINPIIDAPVKADHIDEKASSFIELSRGQAKVTI